MFQYWPVSGTRSILFPTSFITNSFHFSKCCFGTSDGFSQIASHICAQCSAGGKAKIQRNDPKPTILDIIIYFSIRHSFVHLRPVILSADWSIRRLQSWTCSSLPTDSELVKLTQSIVIDIQRQSADLYKVQLCNRQFFVGVPAIYVVKVYECHPLAINDYLATQTFNYNLTVQWMAQH